MYLFWSLQYQTPASNKTQYAIIFQLNKNEGSWWLSVQNKPFINVFSHAQFFG